MQGEQYLAKLRTHWKRQAAFPPMAKLTGIVGLTSSSSVHAMVERLCEAGCCCPRLMRTPTCLIAQLCLAVFISALIQSKNSSRCTVTPWGG